MHRDEVNDNHGPQDELCPHSRAAIDALIEAGFDLDRVPAAERDRCRCAMNLLGMLHTSAPDESGELCRTTVGRVMAAQAAPQPAESLELCPADDDALEALVGVGMDARRVAAGMRSRAAQQARLLGLLEPAATTVAELNAGREAMVSATLERVRQSVTAQESRMRFEPVEQSGRRFRMADLVSLAAMLLLGTAVIWPTLGFAREKARQTACLSNMGAIGQALGLYGTGNRDSLPLASASLAGVPWWNVGRAEQSNSANYYTLKHQHYVSMEQLACGGNPDACRSCENPDARDWKCFQEVSYSFQNLFTNRRPTLSQPQIFAIAVDRSPVVTRAFRGERLVFANENSFQHGGRGQNVLMSDGHAVWLVKPQLENGDNLWLPRRIEQMLQQAEQFARSGTCQPLRGVEEPDGPEDSFLCP